MKNYLLRLAVIVGVVFCGLGGMALASTKAIDDPKVKILHDSLNGVRVGAEAGDPQAQTKEGMIKLFGFGGSPDYVAAKEWFQKAAAQGYPEALVQLGNIYENGLGVTAAPAKALELYKKAADKNYPQGIFHLGLLYLNGTGVDENASTGKVLLQQACNGGYQTSCGLVMLLENKYEEARVPLNLECQNGDQNACGILAQIGPPNSEGAADDGKKQDGGMGIYLLIGLVLVGLAIFWLLRKKPSETDGPGE